MIVTDAAAHRQATDPRCLPVRPPPPSWTDIVNPTEALTRAKTGDRSALLRLLESQRPHLRATARGKLDARMQARVDESDLAQLTLWTAIEGFPAFRGGTEAELVAWLQAILRQHVAAAARCHVLAQKRGVGKDRHLGSIATDGSAASPFDPASSSATPSRLMQREELQARVESALSELPWEQQQVVRLRFLDDWSATQIAEFLGKTERAVAGLLWRGTSRLKEILQDVV